MAAIKHWGRRYDAVEESICSADACMRQGVEIERGQVKCASHQTIRLEVKRGTTNDLMYGVRRLGKSF
jgi:hypothetical protein